MPSRKTIKPRVAQLADRLEVDIEERKLTAHDRYLTTAEAAKLLGVGNAAANRALQVLERRRRIIRQQKRGAFVIDPPHPNSTPALDRVHFLVHQKYLRAEGIGQDDVLLGIEHEFPGVPVQISFLPTANEETFVAELIDDSLRAKRTDSFILVRASFETQRLLAERQIPSVVFGTIYPSIKRLASLSVDMKQVGTLLADYLLSREREVIAYFNRQLVFGGDQQTIEGIVTSLQSSGKGFDMLTLRFLPTSREAYVAEAERLLDLPSHPTGFICRTLQMADAVAEAAERKGLVLRNDLDIVVCDYYNKPRNARYVWAKPMMSSEETGRQLAKHLADQVVSNGNLVRHEVMPVTLYAPEASTNSEGLPLNIVEPKPDDG